MRAMKAECNMNEVDYMQMKNRCMWMTTRIALSFFPINVRHYSTYAIELYFSARHRWKNGQPFSFQPIHYTMMVGDMQRCRLIVRDIVVSATLHLDIVIIFHVAARCVLQLRTIRWLILEYRPYFSWRAFIFTVYDFQCITVDRDRSSFSILLHDTFVADNETLV